MRPLGLEFQDVDACFAAGIQQSECTRGFENAQHGHARLRAEQLTRDIPVVVLSADATKSQINRLLAAGAKDYLTKPLDVDHFLKVIDRNFREPTSVSSNGNGA